MSPTINPPEAVADLCRSLEPAHQSSLLEFAQFLKMQEARAAFDEVDEEDEAAWDRLFNDPAKMANFARCADKALAEGSSEPLDPSRL